jgi:hypothetical protein
MLKRNTLGWKLLIAGVASVLIVVGIYGSQQAGAAKFVRRSLALSDTRPGVVATYTFAWRYGTTATMGSIHLEACTNPYFDDPCIPPVGMDFSAATLNGQTGVVGFSVLSQTTNEVILSRTPASRAIIDSTYALGGVTNPTGQPDTFYVRVRTYASNNATGAAIEENSVLSSTVTPITINTVVPPILYFCVGITASNNCQNVVGNFIDYGDLLDASDNYGTSQFQVATNAEGGYVVTVNGSTIAAGNKIIEALASPTTRQPGTSQFGINLRANTDPGVGSDVFGIGIGSVPADYNIPDSFKYNDGDIVASSSTGSNFDTFTVTYIVNVPPDQPAGVYNTTITYICTAAF